MEFHKKDAIYLQIADIICEKILTRQWREGEKIPSVRDMAVTIEVNPNTVMRAYAHLQEKEIIFNKRGIGYFVADNAYRTTRTLMKSNFVKTDLPHVYATMELLDMDLDELADLFKQYREKNS
jgi:DNA-binding transcriptional regulator YhcF (GntR family)